MFATLLQKSVGIEKYQPIFDDSLHLVYFINNAAQKD